MPTTQQDELKARIERDLSSNSRVRMIMFRKLFKDIIDLIFNQPGNSTNDYEGFRNQVFGTTGDPDLQNKLNTNNILSHILKGLKAKLIQLPDGVTINNYISGEVLVNNLFFEVKPDEILLIKQKVKKPESELFDSFEIYVFNGGAGKWGRNGTSNPDNTINPVYENNFILIDKELFFTKEVQAIIMGEKTLDEYLTIMNNKGYSNILDFIEKIENAIKIEIDLVGDKIISLENLKLDKGTYTGTAQDLKNSIDSKANISHTHDISSITNLQTALDSKQNILTNPVTGTGANGKIAFFNGTNTQTSNNVFAWDNINKRLGIGTETPSYSLDVVYTLRNSTGNNAIRVLSTDSASTAEFRAENNFGWSGRLFKLGDTFPSYKTLSQNDLGFYNSNQGGHISILNDFTSGLIKFSAGGSATPQMTLFSTGNLGINTITDAGFKLDVNGNVKAIDFKGQAVKFNLQTSISPTPNTLVPKTDGSGLLWYDSNSILRNIGENFFSADLSNTTARNHTMNAGITINTLGNPHILSGLPNKNADIANFRKVRVQNTSGLDSVVDSKNLLTDGITSMTDAEKDAWRLAQRKSTETYSTGQPRIDTILPPVINNSNDYIQYVTLVGLNLFINNSNPSTAMVKLKRYKDLNNNPVTETVIDITNYQVYQQNTSILSFGINYNTLQTGYYKVEVTHNDIVNIGTSDLLVSNIVNTNTIVLDSWEVYTPFEPSNLIITPTFIKKTYGSVIRGSNVIEQQVKHFIINASDVLSGFRLRFTYKLSPAGTEPGNVKHRQSISFGLGYNKDVNVIIVPEILISFIRGTLNIGNVAQPSLTIPYIYDIDIVVKNGLATVVVNLTNTGTIYTQTFSFEQKNEQMFFYSTFLGSNPDSSGQIVGTTQELLFPTTYQSF